MAITGPDPLTAARPDQPAAKTRRLMLSGGGFWTALWGSRSGKIGLILVGITLLGALVSILGLAPYDPQYQDPTANLAAPIPRLSTSAGKKICWMFSQGSLKRLAYGSDEGK